MTEQRLVRIAAGALAIAEKAAKLVHPKGMSQGAETQLGPMAAALVAHALGIVDSVNLATVLENAAPD